MQQYNELLRHVMKNGVDKSDRTGTGTRSIFGYQMRFDLSKGFPLVTQKKLHLKSIIHELLWFLAGDTNTKYLEDNGVRIWNEWKDENGDLGLIYGHQWRKWQQYELGYDTAGELYLDDVLEIDQITNLIETIKTNPDSRRMVVSAWNVSDLKRMALSPCHCLFQFYVANGKLSCQLYQRKLNCAFVAKAA